ncbi:YybH family protein [Mangrovibacterium lignilyticum]|uniref:YybH family protein n=1 Tax=Mangrovibacterium lignilyticum TaxID=2668052 RepID=UPI0013D08B8D|nr:DUF4440 domain-containing protein [Mangrovibacterium lignilyticum]
MEQKMILKQNVIFFFLFFLILGGCTHEPVDVSYEIKLANGNFQEAYNNGDAQTLAQNYMEDAKLFPENADVVQGKDAIEEFWAGAIGAGGNRVELETISADKYGNVAIEEGRYKIYAESGQLIGQGKYLVTWDFSTGEWKITKDIWNSSNPAAPVRAMENDSVWVVWNIIKPNKVQQFEDFNFNYLDPAAKEFYPEMRNTVRTLRPVKANDDGTFTYIYLMDPAISSEYSMKLPLAAKYGEEKADEYLKMFEDCLKGGKQQWVVTVQTAW